MAETATTAAVKDGSTPNPATQPESTTGSDSQQVTPQQTAEKTLSFQGRDLNRNDASMVATFHEKTGTPVPQEIQSFLTESGGEVQTEPVSGDVSVKPSGSKADGSHPVEPAKTQSSTQPGQQQQQQGGKATPDAEKLTKARSALKRWQWPDELINSLPEKELIARGEEAARSQSEFDRTASERNNLKSQLGELLKEMGVQPTQPKDETPNPSEPDGQQQQQQQPNPVDKLIESIRKSEVVDDLADPFAEALRQMSEQSNAALTAAQEQLKALQRQNENLLLDQTRAGMIKEWPQLADANKYEQVKKQVYSLANLNGYHDESGNPIMDRLMQHACRIVLGDESTKQQQQQLTERYQRQTYGQPQDLTDQSELESPQAMTLDQKSLYAYELLQKGKKPADIRVILSKIPTAQS